jgi:hypothetical protein
MWLSYVLVFLMSVVGLRPQAAGLVVFCGQG